jgi:hypothetical protein
LFYFTVTQLSIVNHETFHAIDKYLYTVPLIHQHLLKKIEKFAYVKVKGYVRPLHSVFFGPFLSSSFFPPNDRAQNHAQEKPTFSTIFDRTKVSLDAKVGYKSYFLSRWMIQASTNLKWILAV